MGERGDPLVQNRSDCAITVRCRAPDVRSLRERAATNPRTHGFANPTPPRINSSGSPLLSHTALNQKQISNWLCMGEKG